MNKIEIGHCRDCKWWMPFGEIDKSDYGDCDRLCGEIDPYSEPSKGCYETVNWAGYNVPKDFGCIHFGEKENQ